VAPPPAAAPLTPRRRPRQHPPLGPPALGPAAPELAQPCFALVAGLNLAAMSFWDGNDEVALVMWISS